MSRAHPDFLILGYSEAAMMLKRDASAGITALVSIQGQRDPFLDLDVAHRLDLSFDDTPLIEDCDALGQYRARELRRKAADIGLRLKPPTVQDAEAILNFAATLQDQPGKILFQCFAGISRSAGAALLSLAHWYGPGNEREAVQKLFGVRSAAQPHVGLVRLGDTALARQGALTAALEEAQRGRL